MGLVFRHPEPGEMVGDYRILEKIGSGGFGTVFKAERAGLFFAVKMLQSIELGARERREISILLQLENPCVVRFRACDRWLDPKIGTPYIVTDFVSGMTLEEFAAVENPSARTAARIALETALTLGEVHLQGVFHRDLKPENILIQGKDARPVLIDFGVGSYVGAPIITRNGVPPGTYEYRSPEACLFNRANTELAHYEFSATDELWALGVTFYWLLANVLPFGDRNDWERGGLMERIIHQRPIAPHVLNPRIPRALSDLCLRMLEKKPEDRYASVVELCAALDGAMADAEADASWDLPLFDPGAPDTRMTEEDPADRTPLRSAGRVPTGVGLLPVRTVRLDALKRPALILGLAAVVLGAFLFARSLSPPVSAPLDTSPEAATTQHAGSGREVARSAKPLDPPGGEGEEPAMGSISAPVMIMMLRKDDTSEKPQQKKTKAFGRAAKAIGTGLVCKALTGCPAPQQVRPTPEPAPCPAGAVETMKTLGIVIGYQAPATFPNFYAEFITVREGDTTLRLIPKWGKLPSATLLSGRLIFGDGRVYGRLTEAKVPGGETFKVCMEVRDDEEGGRGAMREPNGGPESARIFSTVVVRAVSSFE